MPPVPSRSPAHRAPRIPRAFLSTSVAKLLRSAAFVVLAASTAWAAGTEPPRVLHTVNPDYPPWLARVDPTGGEVVLRFVVTEKGQVEGVTVVRTPHRLLANAAIEALKQWRFKPGLKDGKPVATHMELPVVFHLAGFLGAAHLDGLFTCLNATAVVDPPSLVKVVAPDYPGKLWRQSQEGSVRATFKIDPEGKCADIAIVSASHVDFGRSVEQALRKLRFAPRPAASVTPEVQMDVNFLSAAAQTARHQENLRKQSSQARRLKDPASTAKEGGATETKHAEIDERLKRAAAKVEKGDRAGAIADFDVLIKLQPDSAGHYYERAVLKYDERDFRGSVADAFEAKRLRPDFAEAYVYSGVAKLALRDLAGALAELDRALELKPDLIHAPLHRGLVKTELGDHAGALRDFELYVGRQADSAEGYLNRGAAKAKLGDHDGALTDLNRCLELNPKLVRAYYQRAAIRSAKGDTNGSREDLLAAMRLTSQIAPPAGEQPR